MVEAVDPGTTVFGIRRSEQPNEAFEVFTYNGEKEVAVGYTLEETKSLTNGFIAFLEFIGQQSDVDGEALLKKANSKEFRETLKDATDTVPE